eukprot:6214374-Pleurochrysis_carterae.AAC.4
MRTAFGHVCVPLAVSESAKAGVHACAIPAAAVRVSFRLPACSSTRCRSPWRQRSPAAAEKTPHPHTQARARLRMTPLRMPLRGPRKGRALAAHPARGDRLLVRLRDAALVGGDEARAHLHARVARVERGAQPRAVGDAAGAYERHSCAHQRHECTRERHACARSPLVLCSSSTRVGANLCRRLSRSVGCATPPR